MAYSDFTLEMAVSRFELTLYSEALFPGLAPVSVPTVLKERLDEGQELALISEKARSEFIVAPLLLAVRRLTNRRIAIYSGQRFDFDQYTGLTGECDFILSATEPVPIVRAPVLSVSEAEKGEIDLGLGQCAAQMVASQRFNLREGHATPTVYGCVTTGDVWQFLRLSGSTLTFDNNRLYLRDGGQILAAFLAIIAEVAPPPLLP